MSSFDEFIQHPSLLKVLEAEELTQPTAVQLQTIPLLLAGHHLLVSARTGSGKTLAFLLPSLERLLTTPVVNGTSTRMLVLVPTRELARQIVKTTQAYLRVTPLRVGMVTGGEELKYHKALLRKNPEILVATPGRLAELVSHQSTDFSGLEILVLDEADRMLDLGLAEDVLKIASTCAPSRQTLFFSATLEQKGLRYLIKELIQNQTAQEIVIDEKSDCIAQQVILADDDKHKEKLLLALINSDGYGKAMVFANTKAKTAQLQGLLAYKGCHVSALHGDMTQDQRKRSLDSFRYSRTRVLVATDVAARGLDIAGVDLVINFDVAQTGDEYIHRIGRTGRADRSGRAVSLVSALEWNLMSSIERYLKLRFERISLPGLTAQYQGPKKIKASGKAAGSKKKSVAATAKRASGEAAAKIKVRERDKKNIGKRRLPSDPAVKSEKIDGFAPLRKKPNQPPTESNS